VADIILDNPDPRVTFTGDWQTGTTASGRYGSDYRFALTVIGETTSNAFYRPNIVTPGRYDVYIWFPQGSNRSTNAQWHVSHEGGSVTVGFNQTMNGGAWRLIADGRDFAKGTNGFVRLSNDTGENNKVVIADAVRFAFNNPPVITAHPQSQTVYAGANVTFAAMASGSGPLSYQWRRNGAAIPNATSGMLQLLNVQPANSGSYTWSVGNPSGAVTSAAATLTVLAVPAPPWFDQITTLPDGRLQFRLTGDAGFTYLIEASSNLMDWSPLTNLFNQGGGVEFIDSDSPGAPHRFYRARWSP
jgi:hypothetical protein